MRRLWPNLIAVALLLGNHASGAAQAAKPRAKQEPYDWHKYDNDPCGDPRAESSVWLAVMGKVVKVPAGDRLVIDVPKARGQNERRGVVVQLVGIDAPAPDEPFGRESRQHLESLALGKVVVVATQMNIAYRITLPGEIAGMTRLNGSSLDLNLEQVRAGLARHREAASYTMSNYTECQYEAADKEARAARRGLWRQGGVSK